LGVTVTKNIADDKLSVFTDLYTVLVKPIDKFIQNETLVIIPYGILNYVPFQSLFDGKKYLIEKYAMSYAPSLAVLSKLKRSVNTGEKMILALGNPDLQNEEYDLPAAEKEVTKMKEEADPGQEQFQFP